MWAGCFTLLKHGIGGRCVRATHFMWGIQMVKFIPVRGFRDPAPNSIRVKREVGRMIRKHADQCDLTIGDFVEQCVRFAIEHMEKDGKE